MFWKCWSLYVCENLSKQSVKWSKAINEMGENILCENFLVGSFPGRGSFPGGSLMGGDFSCGSSYNVSILIFQKIINIYNKTFNKKKYTLNS